MLPIIDARSYKGGDKGSVHSMSPLLSTSYQKSTTSFLEGGRFPEYLRRLCDFRQMDFEAAFDQMITLLSFEPQKVYTSFYYRKQTKNQWARDDPAFAVVQAFFVAVAALAYAVAFHHASLWGYIWAVLYAVIVDWLLVGVIITTILSHISNTYLRQRHAHTVEQEVEWLYAFDVHTNAFLCSFVITHVLQYFFLPLLMSRAVLACLFSNAFYALASIWYFYITHLGYRALPFLGNTQTFLWYPCIVICVSWIFSTALLLLGLKLNLTRISMAFHYG